MDIKNYAPEHEFLVCIDSDGCAFDTMEIKHKECFCPATVLEWRLQPVSKYVREIWEYINLYSRDRGRSRFHELVLLFEWLERRPEVMEREIRLPDISSLRDWVAHSPLLNNESLRAFPDDPVLKRTLSWSLECNRRIREMVFGIPPFPGVRESLERLAGHCDIAVVSATAREALQSEWGEHGLMKYVRVLCAQEDGSKGDCLKALAPWYGQGRIMMIGDAPGDMEAAHSNGALFYPIRPGEEPRSWKEFWGEDLEGFLNGAYDKAAEGKRIGQFLACLPEKPPWEQGVKDGRNPFNDKKSKEEGT